MPRFNPAVMPIMNPRIRFSNSGVGMLPAAGTGATAIEASKYAKTYSSTTATTATTIQAAGDRVGKTAPIGASHASRAAMIGSTGPSSVSSSAVTAPPTTGTVDSNDRLMARPARPPTKIISTPSGDAVSGNRRGDPIRRAG